MGLIKMNGVNYWGSSYGQGIIAPMIYSTEEKEVGVWTDGKPLYQCTIDVAPLPNNTTKEIQLDLDIEKVVSMKGYAIDNNDKWIIYFNDVVPSNVTGSVRVFTKTTNKKLYINTGENLSSYTEAYITIQYTKTTDTAGSGIYTPSGALAVHYSTNEQVIGTWIDGKPLYEITLNPTINIGGNTLNHGIANFKECIRIFGKCKYNNGTEVLPLPYVSTNTQYLIACGNVTPTTYLVETGNGFSSIQDCYVTIQYTKSTD